jgi:hypothetical protein
MMDRLECYYRWLTMRVWVRCVGTYWEIETEHNNGENVLKLCYSREEAKAYVDELRKEGNRRECQY